MPDTRRPVTLSRSHVDTVVGRELLDLLKDLSADGNVSREEMERLRTWLEIDHRVDFPALPFLYETIDQISSNGEVTEDELDRLALAIERVLPKDIRLAVAAQRKEARVARRRALMAGRAEQLARDAARARSGVLYQETFSVRGAFRSEERRQACHRLGVGDTVKLEREPENIHDSNAILILDDSDFELGYVPREEARQIARLLDLGADTDASVHRLWETPDGQIVPIVLAKVRQADAESAAVRQGSEQPLKGRVSRASTAAPAQRRGCGTLVACLFLSFALILVTMIRFR